MRQAGRYLPEYRELRSKARDFIHFCLSPELAAEATLQPIRRFGFDGAILFADILLIPDAAGQKVTFVENEGPRLEPLERLDDIEALAWDQVVERLANVCETVGRVRRELGPETALIGFAGAPWTVATYMLGGGGGEPGRRKARAWAWANGEAFAQLMNRLADVTADYLVAQARAGAQALQLFESWAEGLSEPFFSAAVIEPGARVVERVRAAGVTAPIIGFPRGAGPAALLYAAATGVDALGLDTSLASRWTAHHAPAELALQGGLDPELVVLGGAAMDREIDRLIALFADRPYVFNLGHGITPEAPVENVQRLVERVRRNRS